MNDVGFETIALLIEDLAAECPICGEAVLAHRFLGIRSAKGLRWFVFMPHRAPCGLPCVAGGLPARKRRPAHAGPDNCPRCYHGDENAPDADLVLIAESGDFDDPDLRVEWGAHDDDEP